MTAFYKHWPKEHNTPETQPLEDLGETCFAYNVFPLQPCFTLTSHKLTSFGQTAVVVLGLGPVLILGIHGTKHPESRCWGNPLH